MPSYRVDLAELDDTISEMTTFTDDVDRLLGEIDAQVNELQQAWSGIAADAQRERHERWLRGALEMREALLEFRADARRAHSNYSGAAQTNVRMWP